MKIRRTDFGYLTQGTAAGDSAAAEDDFFLPPPMSAEESKATAEGWLAQEAIEKKARDEREAKAEAEVEEKIAAETAAAKGLQLVGGKESTPNYVPPGKLRPGVRYLLGAAALVAILILVKRKSA